MAKAVGAAEKNVGVEVDALVQPEIDSKYRLIIVAAQRSKQLQRGARARVEMDLQRHKTTRVALEEVSQGKINFETVSKE